MQVFARLAIQGTAPPRLFSPSLNCTVPLGVLVFDGGVTTAVKITFCPMSEGLTDDESTVVVAACEMLNECTTFVAEL